MIPRALVGLAIALATGAAAEPYRFDRPAGPQFDDAEKAAQFARGSNVLPLVRQAFAAGEPGVRIPPGDYRFGRERWEGATVRYALEFADLRRDDAHPFVIDATGATFWFEFGDEQMPPGHHAVGFRRCSHVTFRGATIDRGTRGHIEGRITRIDRAGNRFEIAPSPGLVVPTSYNGGHEQRLLPFKSDGRFCAPLYDLQPGGVHLRYRDVTPSSNGCWWVTMVSTGLLERIHDAAWIARYGELGVVREGDGLSCLYSTAQAVSLVDSDHLTMEGLRIHIAKGGGSETGGDGAHRWRDCTFGPRPGTSQWQGGDGFMFNATRHGTTLERVTVIHATDDVANFHGYWGRVTKVDGHTVTLEREPMLRPTLANARPGDRLRFLDPDTGRWLGEAAYAAHQEFVVTMDRAIETPAGSLVEWPNHACAGWTIRDCRFEDSLQRLLILSGPGAVRDSMFTRLGSGVELNTAMPRVGGVPSGIKIERNVFTEVNPRPGGAAISARGHNLRRDGAPAIAGLAIVSNVIVRPGGPAIALRGVVDSRVEDNRFAASALVDQVRCTNVLVRRNVPVEQR